MTVTTRCTYYWRYVITKIYRYSTDINIVNSQIMASTAERVMPLIRTSLYKRHAVISYLLALLLYIRFFKLKYQ